MLGWIFRKKGKVDGPPVPPVAPVVQGAVGSAPAPAPPPEVDWTAVLTQARGDDAALLALARTVGAPLKIKQAAVEALGSESALRGAEREFRSHDRRVHQLAKQRLQAKVAQRIAREQAGALVERARGLAAMEQVAANHVVELEQAWQALDPGTIESTQREEFLALTARLAAQLRRRADVEWQRTRWQADAVAAARQLQAACAEAAAGALDREQLAARVRTASAVDGALPPGAESVPALERALSDLQRAIRVATALDGQLAVLDRLMAAPAQTPPLSGDDAAVEPDSAQHGPATATDAALERGAVGPAVRPLAVEDLQRQWEAFGPLPDPHLAALLQARHARWQQACDQARQARRSQRREQVRERQRARKDEQVQALDDDLAQAEAALDAGRLVDAHRLLSAIDEPLQRADAPAALHARMVAAHGRLAELRGWQQWAGGRARDELVLQAEALAAATAGGSAGGDDQEKAAGGDAVAAEVARLSIRQRTEVIEALRRRWKELDGLGATGGHALWQRFDAALTTAGGPVAAHVSAQRAARQANLAARQQLLESLEAVEVADPAGPVAAARVPTSGDDAASPPPDSGSPAERPGDARALAVALDRFHAEWRKLGPLEHAVPRAAREALVQRMEAAVRRLEASLQAARARAGAQRQALVMRARALVGDDPGRGHELVVEVRALQAQWQQHAKAVPLARADEQALWADFKAAIDAAFAAREAAHTAREAEFEAHAAERSALIERLRLRPGDSPGTQRRTLAEVEAAWQRCGPAPRARAAALDAEFRAAREAVLRWLEASAQRTWQAKCDALDAKVALCMAREHAAADVDAAAIAASWDALPVLPGPLEDALRRRAGLAPAHGTDIAADADDLLLSIETAWDLATPAAFESARRERKLLAMKASLEGRRSAAPQDLAPAAALAWLVSRADLNAGQRERLATVLAAWRLRGPQQAA